MGSATGIPGANGIDISILMSNPQAVDAVELALTFDSATLTAVGWDLGGGLIDTSGAEFVQSGVSNLGGFSHAWLGALVDFATPLEGRTFPAGSDELLARLTFDIRIFAQAPQISPVQLQAGVSLPPRWNLMSVAGGTAVIPALVPGGVDVRVPFIRGDGNRDGMVDISDAIHTLAFIFLEGPIPTCAAAADLNNDDLINIADPAFLLNFLYGGGPYPSEPYPVPGFDPDSDGLGCEE
ncbi:MAG: hypothetical protein ACE5GW_00755 [Planctomycetota bacterium]